MKKINYHELRKMWLDFYIDKGHKIIPSASVVPENDASTLFTTAGMQPLVPYLLGKSHPGGNRLANIQKCIRTNDIDEVGDISHLTFFEMMGNWALGDAPKGYFKREKTAWSYEFLTDKKYLGLDKERIHVTCFAGDSVAPRDEECAKYWEKVGIPSNRIHFLPKSENWWALGSGVGPQGPCSEMFFDLTGKDCKKGCNPSCECGRFVELGNDVYMQYIVKEPGAKIQQASQRNVDTGCGLERMLCFVNGYKSVFESELFAPALKTIEKFAKTKDEHSARILAEHTRAATIIISDGVVPSNSGAGYVLRRLIRRAVRMSNRLGCDREVYPQLIDFFISYLGKYYENLNSNRDENVKIFLDEVAKFEKTLETGLREFEKLCARSTAKEIDGTTAFMLYETFGFPVELTIELAKEKGLSINIAQFDEAREKHSKLSATAAAGAFKGGLAEQNEATARLHTATHILLSVLRETLGGNIIQKGSNITPERLRFDFNFDRKLTPEELVIIENRVNEIISQKLQVAFKEMPLSEAKKMKVIGTFGDKYGDIVTVYSIGNFSHELCGGPHAKTTAELGYFKIVKEESSSSGVRRIKATLAQK